MKERVSEELIKKSSFFDMVCERKFTEVAIVTCHL